VRISAPSPRTTGLRLAVALLAAGAALLSTWAMRHPVPTPAPSVGLPLGARAAVDSALGEGARSYWVRGRSATNPAQGLRERFGAGAVTVVAGGSSAAASSGSLRLGLAGIGRPGALRPVRPSAPSVIANRVSYRSPGVREWFANGPLGLEQGFVVSRRPAAAGRLLLSVAVAGSLRPRAAGGAVLLSAPGGAELRYDDLVATDARGRALSASMGVSGDRIVLSIDDRGAVYPVRVDPMVQLAELTVAAGAAHDGLGRSVAVSGDTIVAGAPNVTVGGNANEGALYVFTEPAGGWSDLTKPTAELTVSNGAMDNAIGSLSLAISGNTIVAGEPYATVGANADEGAVYVWVEPSGGWKDATQTAELTPSDGAANDAGYLPVAIDGSTIVAGYPELAVGANAQEGKVYVFTKPPGGWVSATQSAELTEAGGSAQDELGLEVAIDGNTIAAAAQQADQGDGAAVDVFTEPGGGWANETQTAKLSDSALELSGSGMLGIAGGTIVVGNPYATPAGAAYIYSEPSTGWADAGSPTVTVTPSDGVTAADFGFSVAISGSTIVVGAPQQTIGSNTVQGALYVFEEPATGWASGTQTGELTAADGAADAFLGYGVAIDGTTVVGGAPGHTVGANRSQGAAYVFSTTGANGGGGGGGGGAGSGVPVETSPPVVTGTAKTGHRLSCSKGSWTNSPTSFVYQWSVGGTPIAGATSSTYVVQSIDEQLPITCSVVASNAKGASTPALSRGVTVPVPVVPHCPRASGRLRGTKLGLVRLGMTRAQARRAFTHSSNRGRKYEDFFCLTPIGIRVGYASPKLLGTLPSSERSKYRGRVVWASTSSLYYTVHGIRRGATVKAARKRLKLKGPFRVGRNDWYVAPNGASMAVLKVRRKLIEEVGIGVRALLGSSSADSKFLRSFS
jgi:FG-GAP repeat